MVCSSSPYHFKICKGCRPQILLGSFLNTLSHMPTAVMRNDTPAVVTIMLNRHVRGSFKTSYCNSLFRSTWKFYPKFL